MGNGGVIDVKGRKTIVLSGIAGLAVVGGAAFAVAGTGDVTGSPNVPRARAERIAVAEAGGSVIEAELEEESGLVWEVEVRTARGVTEVTVDAGSGRVLGSETEEARGSDDGTDDDGAGAAEVADDD